MDLSFSSVAKYPIKNNIAILLLAAGSSSRLGHPKQLIKFKDTTLLEKMINVAVNSNCQPIAVVLGAYFNEIKNNIKNKNVHILENKNWELGMGSTIACGMSYLIKNYADIDAVILLVCDQPYLDEKLLNEIIIKLQESEKKIIASKYGKTIGVPALFSKNIFPELLNLSSQQGAKNIIQKHIQDVVTVNFYRGEFDIDNIMDLKKYYSETNN